MKPAGTVPTCYTVHESAVIDEGAEIGDGTRIWDFSHICRESVVSTNVRNPRSGFPAPKKAYGKTLVKRGATLGANCTVACGIIIAEWAFIAAGAVVTGDVEPYALMGGVPARRLGWVSQTGQRLAFENGEAICERTGHRYRLINGSVELI